MTARSAANGAGLRAAVPVPDTYPAAWVPLPQDSAEVRLDKAREYMRMLGRLNRRLRRLTAHLYDPKVITRPQYLVLLWVKNRAGIAQGELATIVDSDANTVSSLVRRLQKKGLLTRSRHPSDRRVYCLRVTPKGAEWVDRIRQRVDIVSLQFYSLLPKGHEAAIAEWLTNAARFDRPL
jgi:DNA-binding MarR family transcriptional regulator